MEEDRLEITINNVQQNLELNSMPLDVAKAFAAIVQAVTKIIEQTPDNESLRLEVKAGSACIIAKGPDVTNLKNSYNSVINNNSENPELVEQYRNIHKVFSANGLVYNASIHNKGRVIPIYETLKTATNLRTKPKRNPPIQTTISFLHGELRHVGGKPNSYVGVAQNIENKNQETRISCTEAVAYRNRVHLYQTVTLSVWKTSKLFGNDYELCDLYPESENKLVEEFKAFFNKLDNASDDLDSIKIVHYKCREFLDQRRYEAFAKFLRLFNHVSVDVNILNTLLIISQSFQEHEILSTVLTQLEMLFNGKLNRNR